MTPNTERDIIELYCIRRRSALYISTRLKLPLADVKAFIATQGLVRRQMKLGRWQEESR